MTVDRAADSLFDELRKLGASTYILSTNVPRRKDGLPYANVRPDGDDPGAAVYFTYQDKPTTMACDHYFYVNQNVRALALTIESMRAIERYGASDMMERVFRGFTALPERAGEYWRDIFGFEKEKKVTVDDVEVAFRRLAHVAHPDKGGSLEVWQQLVLARENAKKDLGVTR